jgi:hypothetical protein
VFTISAVYTLSASFSFEGCRNTTSLKCDRLMSSLCGHFVFIFLQSIPHKVHFNALANSFPGTFTFPMLCSSACANVCTGAVGVYVVNMRTNFMI